MKDWIRISVKVLVFVVAAVAAYKFRGFLSGVALGGMGAVIYFTWTGTKLNWRKK